MATPIGITNGNSSHMQQLRRDNFEAMLFKKMTLRRHLEIYLKAAENKMRNGLLQPTGDMWTRGYYAAIELREQIELLDEVTQ